MEGIDFEKNAAWCDADHSGEAFDRALEDGGEDATCALGVLRRDVARVAGDLEIWFGYSSNFRDVDANEKKAAKKAAKRFATLSAVGGDADDGDDDDASAVDRAVLGFGAVMASTGEAFFLRAANRATTRARLEKIFAKCRVVTYHAQDIVHAAMDAGVTGVDASTTRVVDCRIDAWLANPDRAYDGGIADTGACKDASWSDALGCFQSDLTAALSFVPRGDAPLARDVEAKVAVALGVLQHHGVGFDRTRADEQRRAANRRVEELEREAQKCIGVDINLASAQQVADVLYNKLKLPTPSAHAMKGSKSSHLSTSVEVLQSLVKHHHFAQIVLNHRGALKERAMCDNYDKSAVIAADGRARIHTQWNNTKTATGRLSSSHPNIQQVGRGTMRNCFVAPTGRTFIAADYSQIELRVLAHLSGDDRLISLLRQAKGDVFVAIWNAGKGLPLDAPAEKSTRDIAKRTAYGIVYGQHATGLAEKLGVPKSEAQGYIAAFHRAFPKVNQWITRVLQRAEQTGAVTLPMSGRHRALPKIHSKVFSERSEAQRQAVNTIIQGTAADMMKTAMLRWTSAVGAGRFANDVAPGSVNKKRVTLVAQIHDELLFEVDEDYVPECARAVKNVMENAIKLAVPTPIKLAVGTSWGELREEDSAVDEATHLIEA